MDVVLVNTLGLSLIGAIVWYFFLSRRPEEATTSVGPDVQEIHVTVKGGYLPDFIRARPGIPVRIHFRREETSACSEEVVFPTFGVRRHLRPFETTVVDLPGATNGKYGFACGMDMMHGTLVVGEAVASVAAAAGPSSSEWPDDPICGMKVDPARPAATSSRDGRTIFFCSAGCKTRFDQGGVPMPHGITLEARRKG